jgi:hypothetical protein
VALPHDEPARRGVDRADEVRPGEPLLIQGYEGLKSREAKIPAQRRKNLVEAATRIVPFYEARGKEDKAAEWRAKLSRPPDEPKHRS